MCKCREDVIAELQAMNEAELDNQMKLAQVFKEEHRSALAGYAAGVVSRFIKTLEAKDATTETTETQTVGQSN